jgi:hypothetical protein
MNIQKHIYAIKEILGKEHSPLHSNITNLYIEHILTVERANLLGNLLAKNVKLSMNNYSTVCIPLELTALSDCTNNCFILRSKNKLPSYIADITVRNGNTKISVLNPYTFTYRKKSITKKEFISCYVEDGYLYINGTVGLESILVSAVFLNIAETNNPNEVDCNCSLCVDDYDLVLDAMYIDLLYRLTIARILTLQSNDKTN